MKRHFYSVKRWLSIVSCAALTAGLASVASFPAAQAETPQRAAAVIHDVDLSLGEWSQIGEVEQYLFDNIGNSSRVDLWKFVPNFNEIDLEYIEETTNRIGDGLYAAADVMPGVERNANAAMKKAWSDFDSKLEQVQQEFDAQHNYE